MEMRNGKHTDHLLTKIWFEMNQIIRRLLILGIT